MMSIKRVNAFVKVKTTQSEGNDLYEAPQDAIGSKLEAHLPTQQYSVYPL